MNEKTIHEGRNVKRIREIFGVKQDALAFDLGMSQQAISSIEQKEKIDEKLMEDIARILKVPVDAIKNMTDDSATNFINTFQDNSVNNGPYFHCTINPLEKYIEQVEKNEKLYEDLLRSEREKNALLERIINKK